MEAAAEWLADSRNRDIYLAFCMAVMILPMVALTIWYHRQIRRTPRGRKLMERQRGAMPGTIAGYLGGFGMARDISRGRYGARVKQLQNKVYFVVAIWLVACTICFGVLIAADEMNRPQLEEPNATSQPE